jgi:predicted dehydrogenase
MKAVVASGAGEVAAIADSSEDARAAALGCVPSAAVASSLEELLEADIDGLVIATPSAFHARQAVAALERGIAVFCQKPLGRTAAETALVIEAARTTDRLLAVDLSYRFVFGTRKIRELVAGGELGEIYAVDLVFHNAYGPDKPWFYDAALAGGGCVMDLGTHLVDLALWTLGFPGVDHVSSRLFVAGQPLNAPISSVEDFAVARLDLSTGATVQLACSWRLPVGCDALIRAAFFGTAGGAALQNVNGSFYDFVAERFQQTARETLASPPDEWGGRAIVDWVVRLSNGQGFDPAAKELVAVASALDRIYGR